VQLLCAGLLKEVFHSNDKYIELRKIVGAYKDVVRAGVRLKNQRSAIFSAVNQDHEAEKDIDNKIDAFVLKGIFVIRKGAGFSQFRCPIPPDLLGRDYYANDDEDFPVNSKDLLSPSYHFWPSCNYTHSREIYFWNK